MSSFHVGNKKISYLACSLKEFVATSDRKNMLLIETDEEGQHIETQDLARDLHRMNDRALIVRYDSSQEPAFKYSHTKACPMATAESMATFYQSLKCYLYQCAEGNLPDTALYRRLTKIKDSLANRIAAKSCEDLNITWS